MTEVTHNHHFLTSLLRKPKYIRLIWNFIIIGHLGRKIYYDFKFNELSKEDAENRKRKLLRRYNEAVAEYENFRRVYREYQDNLRRAGTLIAQINKSESTEKIAELACTVIGLMLGDDSFTPRIKKKLEALP